MKARIRILAFSLVSLCVAACSPVRNSPEAFQILLGAKLPPGVVIEKIEEGQNGFIKYYVRMSDAQFSQFSADLTGFSPWHRSDGSLVVEAGGKDKTVNAQSEYATGKMEHGQVPILNWDAQQHQLTGYRVTAVM